MDATKLQLEISLQIAENAKARCRKLYGEDYLPEQELLIRNAMTVGAQVALDVVLKDNRAERQAIEQVQVVGKGNVIQFPKRS